MNEQPLLFNPDDGGKPLTAESVVLTIPTADGHIGKFTVIKKALNHDYWLHRFCEIASKRKITDEEYRQIKANAKPSRAR